MALIHADPAKEQKRRSSATLPQPEMVQGNIIKAFARKYTTIVFLRFKNGGAEIRARLNSTILPIVTSAARQQQYTDAWRANPGKPSPTVGMFGLSAFGLSALGFGSFPSGDEDLGEDLFQQGFRGQLWGWSPTTDGWEPPYAGEPMHAFLLLADDDAGKLAVAVKSVWSELQDVGAVVISEEGYQLSLPADTKPIEHFGFREGIAKIADPWRVFTPDPYSADLRGYGCFATFLKIEQNVAEFRKAAAEIAEKASAKSPGKVTAEMIEELAMGRRHNGDPLVPAGRGGQNDFSFKGVSESICPFHSHIRVMNQRDDAVMPQILRRGVAYGPKRTDFTDPKTAPPSEGVGLLFLSFQRSVLDFVTLFGKAHRSLDPILARSEDLAIHLFDLPCSLKGQKWTIGDQEICYKMADLTTVRGAEYFFIPSMPFLQSLA